jgi:hypothetical protein
MFEIMYDPTVGAASTEGPNNPGSVVLYQASVVLQQTSSNFPDQIQSL